MSSSETHRERWRSFFRTHAETALHELIEAYPRQRSLDVDVLELYDFDESFTQSLFSAPDHVLDAGEAVLRDLHDPFEIVNIRLTNHPGLLPLEQLRARHVTELVTVEGVVESTLDVRVAVTLPAYECRQCQTLVSGRVDGDPIPPASCTQCQAEGPFTFRPEDSRLVDIQRVELGAPEASHDRRGHLNAILDDDLVGSTSAGDRLLVTGVVGLEPAAGRNQFDFILDVNAIDEEPGEVRSLETDVSDELQNAIESRWELLADR